MNGKVFPGLTELYRTYGDVPKCPHGRPLSLGPCCFCEIESQNHASTS